MKKLILLSVMLLSITLNAQQISVNYGVSLPMGDFANSDYESEEAGYALQGNNLGVQFKYSFTDNLGVIASYNRGACAYDVDKALNQFSNELTQMGFYNKNFILTANPYTYSLFGVGPVFSEKFNNLEIWAYFSGGLLSLKSGSMSLSGTFEDNTNIYSINSGQSEGSGSAFGFNAGASMVYNLKNPKWGLKLDVNYLSGKPKLDFTIDGDKMSEKQAFSVVCIGFGFVYDFGN